MAELEIALAFALWMFLTVIGYYVHEAYLIMAGIVAFFVGFLAWTEFTNIWMLLVLIGIGLVQMVSAGIDIMED